MRDVNLRLGVDGRARYGRSMVGMDRRSPRCPAAAASAPALYPAAARATGICKWNYIHINTLLVEQSYERMARLMFARQTDRDTDGQTYRQSDRETGRKTDVQARQTDIHAL